MRNKKTSDNSIFIEVERLTDYKQKFKLFIKIMRIDEFREYFRYRNYNDIFNDGVDRRIEDLWPDEETTKLLQLPSDTVKQWHRMTIQNNQIKLLAINTLDTCDWPEGPKDFLIPIKEDWNDSNFFIFRINGFPTKKGKPKYKTRLRQKLKELNVKIPLFGKIIAPLELDIQVSPKNNYLKKDLDNIILEIADVFSDELLEKGSYLHGYRIYRVKEPQIPSMDSLRFKQFPSMVVTSLSYRLEDLSA